MIQLNFGHQDLNQLFPFHLVFDSDFSILSFGRSISKLIPGLEKGSSFVDEWCILRPKIEFINVEMIKTLTGKLIIFSNQNNSTLKFKGQIEKLTQEDKYIFLGSPWFDDTDHLLDNNLTSNDFALHDSMIDLLHVLKNNEIVNQELKDVLSKVGSQKREVQDSLKRVNDQKQTLSLFNEQLRLFQSLINNSSDGIQVAYEDGQLLYLNNVASERLGLSLAKCNQFKVKDFESVFAEENSWEQHVQTLKQSEFLTVEGININQKTGKRIPVEVTVKYTVISGKGYVIANSRDITDRKRHEQQLKLQEVKLENALQIAQQNAEAKEAFLANMSHEIRTPLNGIIGMIREVIKGELSPKQQSYLGTAQKASSHLLSIINNILDISKIEAGEFKLDSHDFSFRKVLRDVKQILDNQAHEKLINLDIDIDKRLAPAFIGDAARLRQIFINITGNAIKFTNTGGVRIICRVEGQEVSHQQLVVTIEDTGIGMDAAFVDILFTKFHQEDRSNSRKFGGTGLGMVITKELLELMNGNVEVESEKGKGTTVTIRLALPFGNPEKVKNSNHLLISESLVNKSILLVEDNEMNRLVAINALTPYKVNITEAENGKEAIRLMQQQTFDLILMDIQMPIMDGVEATKIIRNKLNSTIPIIALTANAIKSEINTYLATGMNDFVTKPFEEKYLVQVICKNLAIHEMPLTVTDDGMLDVEKIETLYDVSFLHKMSRNNPAFVPQMLRIFVNMIPQALDEIDVAVKQNDVAAIRKIAHKIKTSVGHLQINSIEIAIREIEHTNAPDVNNERLQFLLNKVSATLKAVVTSIQECHLNDALVDDLK